MKLTLLRVSFLASFLFLLQSVQAQCTFTLQMFDAAGDGWDSGSLKIDANGVVSIAELNTIFGDGVDSTISITITDNTPLTLTWMPGDFDEEVSFALYDADGTLLYEVTEPTAGQVFSQTVFCPSCAKAINLVNENIYDVKAKLRWTPATAAPAVGWLVIFGPKGFTPGPGAGDTAYTVQNKITLTGLQKKKQYDWYVVQDCGNGEYSQLAGPESFETYWTNDVGVCGVLSPVTSCDLGVEKLTVQLKNYGAAPQSLINFYYTVNGIDPNIIQPDDGFYTDVLGKDSCETTDFTKTFDFSEPGEYHIRVFTQLENDEDPSNDTLDYYVVNRLSAPYQQDFEPWYGGWSASAPSGLAPSWEWGKPAKTSINSAASGLNAWVTNLDGPYNPGELSYLSSPCFDFSPLTADPVFQFKINRQMDEIFDAAYLEMKIDTGAWNKVGLIDEGLNWYDVDNFFDNLGDVWSGTTNGWETARHRLIGAKGKSEVRFRFVFHGSPFSFSASEGLGVDDIQVYVPLSKDLAGLNVQTAGDLTPCGLAQDKITFQFTNFGLQSQASVKVAYSVNGGTPVVETVTGNVISPDELVDFKFNTPFDSRNGLFIIKCWTQLSGEQAPANDTVTYVIDHRPLPVPFQVDFENGQLPARWIASDGGITSDHNNVSTVFGINMYESLTSFTLTTARYGVIGAADSLSFDYRITDWNFNGTVPTELVDTKFYLEASSDCGNSYQTLYVIDQASHIPQADMQTIKVGLASLAGQSAVFRFRGEWAEGDFYFDVDNINVLACAGDMGLSATVVGPSPGTGGSATVNVGIGNPPYQYVWSNGASTQTISGLSEGQYTVTVTDALGCSNVLTVNIELTATSAPDAIGKFSLAPNPTGGLLQLNAEMKQVAEVQAQLLDLMGRKIWESPVQTTQNLNETIDLSAYPAGLYLVRLRVDGQSVTRKVVKE